MSVTVFDGSLQETYRSTREMLERKRQFDLDRMVEATSVFDQYSDPLEACDKAWWWAQGAKFAADGPLWDVMVDFQDVIEAIEVGVRNAQQ